VTDEKAVKLLSAVDIKKVSEKADELVAWLCCNPNAEKSE